MSWHTTNGSSDMTKKRPRQPHPPTSDPFAFDAPDVSRRTVLGSVAATTTYALIPLTMLSEAGHAQQAASILTATERVTLDAFVDRLIPADASGPGAREAGVVDYIERALAEWLGNERSSLVQGLQAIDAQAISRHGSSFAELADGDKDALITAMENGQVEDMTNAQALFNRLHRLTLEGMFSDPYYGGNRHYIGWDLIGYPGAVLASTPEMQRMGRRLPALHTSAYGGDHDGH
jgi:gluconate 2-dehydrogenase gamma chain